MKGDNHLLSELMKRVKNGCGGRDKFPQVVKGADSDEDMVDRFRTVYSTLYTCADTKSGMDMLAEKIKWIITFRDMDEVNKISSSAVKQAVSQLKARKSNISGGYTFDALMNGPDLLFEHWFTTS